MAAIFAFKCSACDKIHEGSPSFGFNAPDPYLEQPQAAQQAGRLTSDLCEYDDADGKHYFIRSVLEVPIHGVQDPFLWGVWVSLSEKSFNRYVETYDNPLPGDSYFGWLCNQLPWYEDTYALKTRVHPRAGGTRPSLALEKIAHPLCVDFHEGISVQRAQQIAETLLHRTGRP